MSTDRLKREAMPIEEAMVSNVREIAAIVKALERKGRCTKQGLYESITEFCSKIPRASIPRWSSLSRTSSRKPGTRLSKPS